MLLEYTALVSAMVGVLSEGVFIEAKTRVFTEKSSLISTFEIVASLVRKSTEKVACRGKVVLHGSALLFFPLIVII